MQVVLEQYVMAPINNKLSTVDDPRVLNMFWLSQYN